MNFVNRKEIHNSPKVSVILTVYNHQELVKEAIESVLRQTFDDFELIIVNDGSTDHTKEIIEEYKPNLRVKIKNIGHVGRAKALNIGFQSCKGQYITIIDSDDLYLPEKLERQVEYLDLNPDTSMVGTNSIEHDLIKDKKYLNLSPDKDDDIKQLLLYDTAFPFPVMMTRKAVLRDVGFCDERMKSKIDFELFGRIAARGKVANIPDILVIIRRHPRRHFRHGLDAEHHRKTRLKVRWLNLWRLKPPFLLFSRILLWIAFEYSVNLFPKKIRHLMPNNFRNLLKRTKLIHPVDQFSLLKTTIDL